MVFVEILRHVQLGLVVIVPMQEFGEKADRELDTSVPRAEALYQLAMKSQASTALAPRSDLFKRATVRINGGPTGLRVRLASVHCHIWLVRAAAGADLLENCSLFIPGTVIEQRFACEVCLPAEVSKTALTRA
jgi:hypothetical protein